MNTENNIPRPITPYTAPLIGITTGIVIAVFTNTPTARAGSSLLSISGSMLTAMQDRHLLFHPEKKYSAPIIAGFLTTMYTAIANTAIELLIHSDPQFHTPGLLIAAYLSFVALDCIRNLST